MGVGIEVGNTIDEIGTSEFLHAFFSTVSGRLETHWGERFPALMQLYKGSLSFEKASTALAELAVIRSELTPFSPNQVIWNIKDRTKMPPWGNVISDHITSLSNYFVTSAGRDLIEVLEEALQAARDERRPVNIVPY